MTENSNLKRTALFDLSASLGGKMVPFAGYEMPVQFKLGVLSEHLHTRDKAGMFDVSHMGQAVVRPHGSLAFEDVARALETVVPSDLVSLKPGEMRYTVLLNTQGGILDDLMVTRGTAEQSNEAFLVVNAAVKDQDFEILSNTVKSLPLDLEILHEQALIALQGPDAETVLAPLLPCARALTFMTSDVAEFGGRTLHVSRSGYTGEDGFEVSMPSDIAEEFARLSLASDAVEPIGLGARDSLRLEAGLCLYGHDISQETSPVEANLKWTIPKRRREAGDFPGAERILGELDTGSQRIRVGLRPIEKAPVREGAVLFDREGREVGVVTSGGFGPSVGAPVAMGYVTPPVSNVGTELFADVRGKKRPLTVSKLPFVPHKYRRK